MKLSHPLAIKSAALLLSASVNVWFSTLTTQIEHDDPQSSLDVLAPAKVYLFWHEMLLLPAYLFASKRVSVLISEHRDGELVAQVIRMMRGHATRGSTKNGATALRRLMRRGQASHLAITPDGPRGPRRVVQPGAIFLASRRQMPIVPVGFAYGDNWRVKSWDRMALPIPGEHATAVFGRPIVIPPELDRDAMESHRATVQSALDDCQLRAEQAACRASGTDWATVAALAPLPRRVKNRD